jgi:hypothetical protein
MGQAKPYLVKAALAGAAAGATGTAAMDVVEYLRYRRGGGNQGFVPWETAQGVNKWDDASAPGRFGKQVVARITGQELPDRWARPMTDLVHWATGLGWGAQFGLVSRLSPAHQLAKSALLGPTAWLAGYVILPLAKVYKPIWKYDWPTLSGDFRTHMIYGTVTAASFAALTGR